MNRFVNNPSCVIELRNDKKSTRVEESAAWALLIINIRPLESKWLPLSSHLTFFCMDTPDRDGFLTLSSVLVNSRPSLPESYHAFSSLSPLLCTGKSVYRSGVCLPARHAQETGRERERKRDREWNREWRKRGWRDFRFTQAVVKVCLSGRNKWAEGVT